MKNYTLLSCIESKMIHPTQLYGRFELGQFATGQAVTVANTLRRALLSQLPGVAITLVHIANVSHEYESVPGIQEPVLDIISNLKKIVFTSEFEVFQPQIGYLHLKGPAVVRAGDLKLPFFIKCVNPEQYITTLTEHGDFRLTVLLNSGKQHLNHTPDSTGYHWRVSILKQQLCMFDSPTFAKQRRGFYVNWHQQQKSAKSDHLTKTARFIKTKLAQKLWKRQQSTQPKPLKKKTSEVSKQRTAEATTLFNQKINHLQNIRAKASRLPVMNQAQIRKKFAAAVRKRSNDEYYQYLTDFRTFMEKRNKAFNIKGYFPVNAFFSPVTKVNYTIHVEENRVGENVSLEIWTNGSIDPRRAIHRSVKALIKLFLPFQLIQHNNNRWLPVPDKITQQQSRYIKKKEFKKCIKQYARPDKDLSQWTQTSSNQSELPTDFLRDFKKKRVLKPSRRINATFPNRFPTEWSQLQQRRRKPRYTYIQPIDNQSDTSPFLYPLTQQRQLLRHFRMFFPLFNIVDRFCDSYGLKESQYDKLSHLNILNLELPFGIYKFLWRHKVQNIGDLFLIHYKMINKSISVKKKVSFYRAFHTAFSKLFYQLTGNKQSEAKTKIALKYQQEAEAKEKEAKEKKEANEAKKKKAREAYEKEAKEAKEKKAKEKKAKLKEARQKETKPKSTKRKAARQKETKQKETKPKTPNSNRSKQNRQQTDS